MPETVKTLYQNTNIRVEQIESHGEASPTNFWYDQDEWEWVKVTKGNAILAFEHEQKHLFQGQSVMIPPHQKHRVHWTSADCEWLCVYFK